MSVLNNDLIIPAGGGSAEVMFLGIAGQTVTITLTGHKTTMVPSGILQGPNGALVTAPPASSSVDGVNTIDVNLVTSGTYRLVIRDDSGQGGTVTVRVEH